jgi:cytochrome c-type biogenesis protein
MSLFFALMSALWLGILTSVSPCPLASNVAAVSYLGRDVERPFRVLLSE